MLFFKKPDKKNNYKQSEIILENISDGVLLVDEKNIIQMFNHGAEDISGWKAEDAINLDVHSVLKFVDEKGTLYDVGQNPFDTALRDKKAVKDNNAHLKSPSGKTISISITVTPLIQDDNENDQASGAVAIFRDVSEERQQEKQRAEFISTASHEMRTPVAAIEGYIALALNEKVAQIDSKARDYLEKAHTSTQRLGQLFQDLLTAAKSEDGRLSNHPKVVDIGQFVEEFTADVRFAAEKKGLTVATNLMKSGKNEHDIVQKVLNPLYYCYIDPDRLREVMTNLFDNAVKYTSNGGITIGVNGDENTIQLSVKDTGQGIAREDLPHLFQKFYRVDNSATRTIGGSGLGLFICRKIVELYNGRIWAESELDKGSTFYINLPRLSSQKAKTMLTQEANQVPPPPLNA